MKLYEIQAQIQQILDIGIAVDEETGEVLADESQLEALQMEEAEKLENIICYYKNLNADADAIKAEEQALKKRREAIQARSERLSEYIADRIKASGRAKFEAPRCVASFRKSAAVEIQEDVFFASAPEELVRVKRDADKTAIKKAIQSGQAVAGATIVERESLQVK